MTGSGARRPRSPIRRLERWLVGLAMAVIAFIAEKAVLRGVRKRGERVIPEGGPIATSRGGQVDTRGS